MLGFNYICNEVITQFFRQDEEVMKRILCFLFLYGIIVPTLATAQINRNISGHKLYDETIPGNDEFVKTKTIKEFSFAGIDWSFGTLGYVNSRLQSISLSYYGDTYVLKDLVDNIYNSLTQKYIRYYKGRRDLPNREIVHRWDDGKTIIELGFLLSYPTGSYLNLVYRDRALTSELKGGESLRLRGSEL